MAAKVKDMTSGSPGKLIMLFAIPLMLGNVFQQVYTMVDTMVVGQLLGVEALAALGAADWFLWLVLGLIPGMTQGFSILISQYYGAKDWKALRKAVAYSYILTAILSVLVFVVSQLVTTPILLLLKTPENIIGLSLNYLRIVFCGIPIIAAYNVFAAMLRALGNSRSPLIAMIMASIINIVLDLLFVGVFDWGVGGAAAATVIAQGFSAIYCFLVLRTIREIFLKKEDFQDSFGVTSHLLRLGFPLAFQNLVIAVGGMAVQFVINGYGFLFVAGFTATNKMYGLLEMAALAYGYAVTTYVGQNLGAGKYDRIKKGMRSSIRMAIITSVVISSVMLLLGKRILSLFVSGSPSQVEQVLVISYKYLAVMAVFLWVLYLLYVYRSALQGLGNTIIPLLSGVVEFVMRVGVAMILPGIVGESGIFFAEIAAWSGAALLLMVGYYREFKRI